MLHIIKKKFQNRQMCTFKIFEHFQKLKHKIDKLNFSTQKVVWRHRNGWFFFLPRVKNFNHYPQEGCTNRIKNEILDFARAYSFALIPLSGTIRNFCTNIWGNLRHLLTIQRKKTIASSILNIHIVNHLIPNSLKTVNFKA